MRKIDNNIPINKSSIELLRKAWKKPDNAFKVHNVIFRGILSEKYRYGHNILNNHKFYCNYLDIQTPDGNILIEEIKPSDFFDDYLPISVEILENNHDGSYGHYIEYIKTKDGIRFPYQIRNNAYGGSNGNMIRLNKNKFIKTYYRSVLQKDEYALFTVTDRENKKEYAIIDITETYLIAVLKNYNGYSSEMVYIMTPEFMLFPQYNDLNPLFTAIIKYLDDFEIDVDYRDSNKLVLCNTTDRFNTNEQNKNPFKIWKIKVRDYGNYLPARYSKEDNIFYTTCGDGQLIMEYDADRVIQSECIYDDTLSIPKIEDIVNLKLFSYHKIDNDLSELCATFSITGIKLIYNPKNGKTYLINGYQTLAIVYVRNITDFLTIVRLIDSDNIKA